MPEIIPIQSTLYETCRNLPEAFIRIASSQPSLPVYFQAVENSETGKRDWQSANYEDVSKKIWKLSHYLLSKNVLKGDGVAIISGTRPEWLLSDLAIQAVGGISVSVYQSLNEEESGYILFDSQASVVFAENKEQVGKILSLLQKPFPIPSTENRPAQNVSIQIKQIITFEKVSPHPLVISLDEIFKNSALSQTPPTQISSLMKDDIASLVYTSGTTGPPKGVIQSHGNHLANIDQSTKTGLFALNGDIFLFLPLAHSFARLIGYLGFMTTTALKFPAIVDRETSNLHAASVLRDLREANAQVIPTVPRILEKMLVGLRQKASSRSLGGMLLRTTLSVAKDRYQQQKEKKRPHLKSSILFLLTTPLRRKIQHSLFGKRFSHIVSGGAKLPVEVTESFDALGITIYEGYGLTETCVATNVNRINKNKIGSVGPALQGIELKISSDGEILFRGPNITRGYLNRPLATDAQWDTAGWFHTGDLGRLDEDGYLYITGRKKELIVTAGGKKIAPQPIEEQLQASPYISHALVYGEGRPYCIALLSLEKESLKSRLSSLSGEIGSHPEVLKIIENEIEKVNAHLSRFESIKTFRVIPFELTVENGFLTPTFKVKRGLVFESFKDLIESAYHKTQN